MTTTTNIKLSTPAHGSQVDVWDSDPINNNSTILDAIFGTVTSKPLTNANVTLSATEAQASVLRFSGVLTGNVTIDVSAIIKSWSIDNLTTGNFAVTISGGSGNVVGVPQGDTCQVYWDGTNCKFINLGRVGTYWDYAGATVPLWVAACTVPPYLLCDGSTFSAVTYPYLNTLLGGTTLPDARARSRIPLDGGTGRVTTAGSGIDGLTRLAAGGAQNVALVLAELAAHDHGAVTGSTALSGVTATRVQNTLAGGSSNTAITADGFGVPSTPTVTFGGTDHVHSITSAGSGTAHNNMPPSYVGGITLIRAA